MLNVQSASRSSISKVKFGGMLKISVFGTVAFGLYSQCWLNGTEIYPQDLFNSQ